eukprot:749843-Hanusia_phi.AAC.1
MPESSTSRRSARMRSKEEEERSSRRAAAAAGDRSSHDPPCTGTHTGHTIQFSSIHLIQSGQFHSHPRRARRVAARARPGGCLIRVRVKL